MANQHRSVSTRSSARFFPRLLTICGGVMALAAVSAIIPALAQAPEPDGMQPNPEQPGREQARSLDDLVVLMKRNQPPLGSRSNLCAINPGQVGDTDQIWSDRPIFLWQGDANQIAVREFESHDLVWTKDLAPRPSVMTHQIPYDGMPLQPGQLYTWELTANGSVITEYTFEVLPADERDRIATDLQTLDAQLQSTEATDEAIALSQAKYFADQGLWSDALNILYQPESSSPAVNETTHEIETYLCSDRSS